MLQNYKNDFAQILSNTSLDLDTDQIISNIEIVPSNIDGDLWFPCFRLSKEFKKSPNQIAQDIVWEIDDPKIIEVWPYINYIVSDFELFQNLFENIQDQGKSYWKLPDKDIEIVLEWRQPNTHKAFHIWHLRNALVWEAVSSCLERAGYDVHRVSYLWDIWAHVAKWIRYYINFSEPYSSETLNRLSVETFIERAWKIYSDATKKVDEDPESYKPQIQKLQKKLEDGDTELNKIWQDTRTKCIQDFEAIFDELWCDIQKWYYESDVEKPWIQKVKELLDSWVAQIGEWWSIIMDLEEYKLWIFLLLKSTWASLYSTKDIWLAYLKQKDFPNYQKSLYIVGSEQEHHFRQLFKTLEIMWFPHDALQHISYGLVDLKDWKMSSRGWNVILYTQLRDQLLQEADKMIHDRNIPSDQKELITNQVAFWAMKFDMLLPDASKKILFDPNEALSFEWETWPYIQYTHARCSSLLKKWKLDIQNINFNNLFDKYEKNLLIHLAQFSDYVSKAAEEFRPNYVARYLLDLSKLFNSYYNNTDKKITENNSSLALVFCIRQVISNGLKILWIESPDEM